MTRDNAVSPVIGSILLVAITVIIAAVIAAFVFGMTGDIQQTRVVAITSDGSQNPTDKMITLTNHGGKDVGVLSDVVILIEGGDCTPPASLTNPNPTTAAFAANVGETIVCAGASPGEPEHVVVTGIFVDGIKQVLLDTYE